MVIICYGMPRSASTFIWQITYDLINYKYKQHTIKEKLEANQRPNFIYNVGEVIDDVVKIVPDDAYYLIKTHGNFDERIRNYEKEGKVKVICSIRDPYDTCVSWLDIHEKEKNLNERGREGFQEIGSIKDVENVVLRDIDIAKNWLNSCNPLVFRYPDIIDNLDIIIRKIVDHIGLEVYLYDKVFNFYKDTSNINEFNKGVSGRGKTIRQQIVNQSTIKVFDEFLSTYLK